MNRPDHGTREIVRWLLRDRFGKEEVVVRAPGRINAIGEHTDYNGGLALPGATGSALWIALRRNGLGRTRIVARDLQREYDEPVDVVPAGPAPWPRFLLGTTQLLRDAGCEVGGFDAVYASDIPLGMGMSSSSALACGLALGVARLFDRDLDRGEIAEFAQRTEQRYVGTQSGPMDALTIAHGRAGHLLLLDFGKPSRTEIRVPPGACFVLCDSGVERSSSAERYNMRRTQCETSLGILRERDPSLQSLRDAGLDLVERCAAILGEVLVKRCCYVIRENERVIRAAIALRAGNWDAAGRLISESHEGLRSEYETSCEPVDRLVAHAATLPGVYGSRVMGTGFGGSTIALVRSEDVRSYEIAMGSFVRDRLQRSPRMLACSLAGGVSLDA